MMCSWQGLDFQAVYSGLELNRKVESLRRNTQYKFRVSEAQIQDVNGTAAQSQ